MFFGQHFDETYDETFRSTNRPRKIKKLKVWYKRGRLNPSKTLFLDGFAVISDIFFTLFNALYTL